MWLAGVISLLYPLACSPGESSGSPQLRVRGYQPATRTNLRNQGWRTDLSRTSVPLEQILVGPDLRSDFRPIEAPRYGPAAESPLHATEPVLVWRTTEEDGAGRVVAWPLVHLLRRELLLDRIGEVPIAVSFCSMCSSAQVLDRRLDDQVLTLRVSGLLLGANSLLFDQESESLFEQASGRAIAGAHSGRSLRSLPSFIVSLGALREAHPDAATLLEPEATEVPDLALIAAEGIEANRLPDWIESSCPAPLELLLDHAEASEVVVLEDPETAPVHRRRDGTRGPSIGSRAAFSTRIDGKLLHFEASSVRNLRVDVETGSSWNRLGEAVSGPLEGARLQPLDQVTRFRYSFESLPVPLR